MSFEETTILECNRLSSEEGKTNNDQNPALYTNKIGSGLRIKAGDKVSIHSSFISELGAGSETIQFSGKTLTDKRGNVLTHSLDHIIITDTSACYTSPINGSNTHNAVKNFVPLRETASASTTTFNLKDNEVNIQISYYKTRNGQCCLALPRRFSEKSRKILLDERDEEWIIEDSVANGLPFKGISLNNGGVLVVSGTAPSGDTNAVRCFFVEDDYIWKDGSGANDTREVNSYWKLKSDNSRYKIFINKDATGVKKAGFITGTGSRADMSWYSYSEPSQSHYVEYNEILTLTAPIGFSSPTSLASNLTNQLRETGVLSKTDCPDFNAIPSNELTNEAVRLQRPVSVNTSSNTYKPFNSFSVSNHNASTYFSFMNGCFSQDDPIAPTAHGTDSYWFYNQYLQNYQYIGIKRGDFYTKGMELLATFPHEAGGVYNKCCFLDRDIDTNTTGDNNRYNASIVLDHEWTDSNLLAWKNWLDTQGNYPELFTNRNNNYDGITTISNSRFLHLNLNACQTGSLGGDNTYPTETPVGRLYPVNASSHNSVPLFFDFDESASNTYTDGSETYPCYGFAYKKLSPDGEYKISFSTTSIGREPHPHFNACQTTLGIPHEYAWYSGSSASASREMIFGNYKYDNTAHAFDGRLCGFDKHFNAFGNAVIGLTDGYLKSTFGLEGHYAINTLNSNDIQLQEAIIDATPFAEKVYLGSQEPLIAYNETNNKFNIQQLHTPEYIGNLWNAGVESNVASENTTSNPNAQQKVFKINKRLDNNDWTPDMMPYTSNNASALVSSHQSSGGSSASYTLSLMNEMISPWTIFDSQSGIIIEDFGIPESSWNKSLWEQLGFTYSQFHKTISSDFNFNTRLTEINKLQIPFGLTNCDISAGDTINFMANLWGSVGLTPQVPLPILFNGVYNGQTPPFIINRYPNTYPAISESQTSILLEAINLPRKMSRAYYTIRSSLLDSATYLGSKDSGEPLKTIGIVNKINGDGDYYFQESNDLVFTITNEKTISDITTSIHEPDGSFAQINRDSCVIYRVDRIIQSSLNPIQELLQATNNKK